MTTSNAELLAAIGWTDIKKREQAVKDLFQAREQQLLTELLGELPPKSLALRKMYKTDKEYYANLGFNAAIDQVVSVIQRLQNKTSKIGELNG